jgi:hypothetical protein
MNIRKSNTSLGVTQAITNKVRAIGRKLASSKKTAFPSSVSSNLAAPSVSLGLNTPTLDLSVMH